MEAAEETVAVTKEQSLILKGKRTKRQRLQSPIPFSIAPPIPSHHVEESSSLHDDDHDHGDSKGNNSINATEEEEDEDNNNSSSNNNKNSINKGNDSIRNGVCYANGVTISASSASSSSNNNNNNNFALNAEDEEDQDMAHCLILLAQGHSLSNHHQQQEQHTMIRYHETGNNNNNNNNNNNSNSSNGFRFSSRKFLETSMSNGNNGGGKAGYYVYQCKTCDRTFPSFQALGGHRASHKKPKALHHSDLHLKKPIHNDAVSLRLTSVTTTSNHSNHQRGAVMYGAPKASNSGKVHECGICGAEFTSGQALGGHMRRHRGAVVAAAATSTALSLSPMSIDQSDGRDYPAKKARSTAVSLDLDLNLPAPEDENRVNGTLGFASKQEHEQQHQQQQQQQKQREEQKSIVLSAPTLVDCHY